MSWVRSDPLGVKGLMIPVLYGYTHSRSRHCLGVDNVQAKPPNTAALGTFGIAIHVEKNNLLVFWALK